MQKLEQHSLFWKTGGPNPMVSCSQGPGLQVPRPQELLPLGFQEVHPFTEFDSHNWRDSGECSANHNKTVPTQSPIPAQPPPW